MSNQTILCVDDDLDDQLLVCETVRDINPAFKVETALNGVEALDYLKSVKGTSELPCIIILDINMPGMDGKQTLVQIKKDENLRALPLFMFSTSSSKIDKLFCESYGVDLFTKPDNVNDLTLIVKKFLCSCQ
jgi:CheY-like chemotaxis protein